MKVKNYRVELFNDYAPINGMCSDFAKHTSLVNARNWAIERGKKGEASYVRLYEKSENRYNHYVFVAEISLI
jgi:hypothetical protein